MPLSLGLLFVMLEFYAAGDINISITEDVKTNGDG